MPLSEVMPVRGRYLLLNVLIGLSIATQTSARGNRETGPTPAPESTVRFDLYRDYLIVADGSAGPLKGLHFLLDTGASPTVLDSSLARKLHLDELPAKIVVLDGKVDAEQAIVPSLQFGPVRRDNLRVLIKDLSFLEKALPVRIDGIIGLDVLGQSTFVIDYRSRQIHFGSLPSLPISAPFHIQDGMAIVDLEVNHAPVHLLFDTGTSAVTLFETRMRGSVPDLKVRTVQRSTNILGDFERKSVRLHSLRLGEAEFGQEPAFVVDSRHSEHDFDGLFGPVALGITRIAVDMVRGELAFSR